MVRSRGRTRRTGSSASSCPPSIASRFRLTLISGQYIVSKMRVQVRYWSHVADRCWGEMQQCWRPPPIDRLARSATIDKLEAVVVDHEPHQARNGQEGGEKEELGESPARLESM